MERYKVYGMSCAACQARVEKAVLQVDGVSKCAVSLLTNSMIVKGKVSPNKIIEAVEKAGYKAEIVGANKERETNNTFDDSKKEIKDLKIRLVLSVIFLSFLMYITMGHNMLSFPVGAFFAHNHLGLGLVQLLLSLSIMIINYKFFASGTRSLFLKSPNMDTLVAFGSSISFFWSVWVLLKMTALIRDGVANMDLMNLYHNELYFESAAMIPTLITIGKLLEAISKGKTTNALKNLIALQPKKANVIRDNVEITIDISKLSVGDIFIVRTGENIPADGTIIEGSASIDESSMTGESIPVDKSAGDTVSAGTINTSGFIKCRVQKVGNDTFISKIIQIVSDASLTKAPIARIADKISAIFVPSILVLSFIVFIGWLIAGAEVAEAIKRAISTLIISCPCALGLATPVAIMVANGLGAKNAILIKTAQALEMLGRIKIAIFDKTGTITNGKLKVTDVITEKSDDEKLLFDIANALESKSSHPIAKAIVEECLKRNVSHLPISDFAEDAGRGIKGIVDGKKAFAGNLKYIESLVDLSNLSNNLKQTAKKFASQGKTSLYFAYDDKIIGIIALADTIKDTSISAIKAFKNHGIKTVMLTGDNRDVAQYIGNLCSVDKVISEVLPTKKAEVVENFKSCGPVAMIGDGINDAPALVSADIGMAVGAGMDVAIDSASVVLVNNNLNDALSAIKLGRGTLRNIKQNLFWAFLYNILCIPLAAGLFGLKMNPMFAALAMSLSSVSVCLNALRLNRLKIHDFSRKLKIFHKFKFFKRKENEELQNFNKVYAQIALPLDTAATSPAISRFANADNEREITLKVAKMMCPHCEKNVVDALCSLDFVKSGTASFKTGIVSLKVAGIIDETKIKEVIEKGGYKLISISQ